jgi:endo-1,4-beta-mannosidase
MRESFDAFACAVRWIVASQMLAVALLGPTVRAGSGQTSTALGLIAVSPDGKSFIEQPAGRAFVPFGVNYYDPNTGWAPKIWRQFDRERVTRHFEVMRGLGVNCARVFLAAATFQPDVNTVDERALAKLDAMVQIAREHGIRLILTGPDHWEGVPAYWKPDRWAGAQSLKALDNFWRTIGRRYRGEPAILAWDLLNEPHIPWFMESWRPAWNQWLQTKYGTWEKLKAAWAGEIKESDSWGNIGVPQDKALKDNPRLLDWQLFRESLADEWVRRQVEALRKADPTHLVTVGYIQWSYPLVRGGNPSVYAAFNPQRQAQWLDFLCMHFYPLLGRPLESKEAGDRNLAYLQSTLAYCHVGKPVVLEEFGWYGGGAPRGQPALTENEQDRWIVAEIEATRRLSDGWLSWPFADTPTSTDMSKFGGLVRSDLTPKPWAKSFAKYASDLTALPQPTPKLPSVDVAASLTTPADELKPLHDKYSQVVQAAIGGVR